MPTFQNARTYLREVVRRYRELLSYSDTGMSYRPHCRRDRLCTFETDYSRPADFRFHFESPHPYRPLRHLTTQTTVGIRNAKPYFVTRYYQGDGRAETPEDLDLAIAGATGISSGTAHTIASLLFPEVSGFSLLDLRRIRFRRSRVVDGVRCVAVSGLHPYGGGRYTAWFGEQDFLLRRLLTSRFKAEENRTNIRTSHVISEDRFAPPRVEA